jgi:hypothetical protein
MVGHTTTERWVMRDGRLVVVVSCGQEERLWLTDLHKGRY